MNVAAEAVLILAGATGAGAGVAALARLPTRGGGFEDPERPRVRRVPPPAQFVRLERIVEWSDESGMSAHTRLRPVLVEIAEARLVRRGVRLERDVEESRRLLGPAVWELVRPDRPTPRGRDAPGSLRAGSRRCSTCWRRCERPREVAERAAQILDEVELAVVGKRDALELVLLGLLADGHVLIQDNPGLAKTLMARSFASVTGLRFARVQFTPDLMPSDVTGSAIYDQRSGELRFQPGPIFTNILLGDEINRAPPKTQAALLEAMQERQVTSEDGTRPLERPFLVLATQNPIEYEGTYPLPEAQLDRFLLRISVGYPDREAELELLARRLERGQDEVELRTIIDREELLAMQRAVEQVHADAAILEYAVDLVTATRESPQVQVGSSPRGTLALLKLARARAALEGRDFVTPDDVKRIAVPALAHRIMLRPELWIQRVDAEDVVRDCLDGCPVPPARVPDRR